jgi:hypothetical protein
MGWKATNTTPKERPMSKTLALTILLVIALFPLNALAIGMPTDLALVPSGLGLALLTAFFGTPA